jgi:hypothetical protein
MDSIRPTEKLSEDLRRLAQLYGEDLPSAAWIAASRLLFRDLMDAAQVIAQHCDRCIVCKRDVVYSIGIISKTQYLSLGQYYGEVGESDSSVNESDYARESISSDSQIYSSLSPSSAESGESNSQSSASTSRAESDFSRSSDLAVGEQSVVDFSDTFTCSLILTPTADQTEFVLSIDAIIDLIRGYQELKQSVYLCTFEALCSAIEIFGHHITLNLLKQTK